MTIVAFVLVGWVFVLAPIVTFLILKGIQEDRRAHETYRNIKQPGRRGERPRA